MIVLLPNIRHLKCFYEAGVSGHIGAAAMRVNLSQPAVTQAIFSLERQLGVSLLDRLPSAVSLTVAGAILHHRIKRFQSVLTDGAKAASRAGARVGDRPRAGFQVHLTASQLRALTALARAENFSHAARDCGISQPSIHRAARDLEALSGLALFKASRQGTSLTRAGQVLAKAVNLATGEYLQALDEISALAGHDSSRIRVGSMPLSRSAILPQAIDALVSSGDPIQVQSIDGPYTELLRGLRQGDIDVLVGALRDPSPADDVVQEHLFMDPLAIVAGPGHPLIDKADLTKADLLDFPWIAPPKTTPAGAYLARFLDLDGAGETPVRVVSSSLVLLRGLLARGPYLSIISVNQIELEAGLGQINRLDFTLPNSNRSIGLTTRKDWQPTPTQSRFLDLIRKATISHS